MQKYKLRKTILEAFINGKKKQPACVNRKSGKAFDIFRLLLPAVSASGQGSGTRGSVQQLRAASNLAPLLCLQGAQRS